MQRSTFIKNSSLTVLSISVFGGLNWNGKSFEGDTPTTTDILGPFYRPGAPIRTNLRLPASHGTPIILKGNIFKEDGKTPISNALVEINTGSDKKQNQMENMRLNLYCRFLIKPIQKMKHRGGLLTYTCGYLCLINKT